jgi:ribonuclease HI
MTTSEKIKVYCDGGSRGNPGPAASGVVFLSMDDKVLGSFHEYLGVTTNNQAEYRAVVLALSKMRELGYDTADFYLDSELVVRQLTGRYKVKNLDLKPIYQQIISETSTMNISFTHVLRALNKLADEQVNICLDNLDKYPQK